MSELNDSQIERTKTMNANEQAIATVLAKYQDALNQSDSRLLVQWRG